MDDEEFRRFMAQINTKLDDILDKLSAMRADSLTPTERIAQLMDELHGKRLP